MDNGQEAQGLGYEFEVKEQDRWLPIANVARIMKMALPENAKIAIEAKECMLECVNEFISFIASNKEEDLHLRDVQSHERPLAHNELYQLHQGPCMNHTYKNLGWHRKRRHRSRTFGGLAFLVYGLAVTYLLPCTAALLTNHNWVSSSRAISGVVSTSAGVSLISLQTETGYDALRWAVRVLWASTYCAFLTCSYLSIVRKNHIYLFCSLLLAVHFIAGFAGTAENATEGILMFGPLASTVCAALVYIPFRNVAGRTVITAAELRPMGRGGGDAMQRGRSNSAPTVPEGNSDPSVRATMTGILGVVV